MFRKLKGCLRISSYTFAVTTVLIILYAFSHWFGRGQIYRPTGAPSLPVLVRRSASMPKDVREKVVNIFREIDTSGDDVISVKELSAAISKHTHNHLKGSLRSNMKTFFALDKKNPNGLVEWDEWVAFTTQDVSAEERSSRVFKEKIAEAMARWSEAARSNPAALNIDEFLSFSHPEFSSPLVLQGVEEILAYGDKDKDGRMTEDEFLARGAIWSQAKRELRQWEFKFLDANHDGFVTKEELFPLMDAKTSFWAARTARAMLVIYDANLDGYIELKEIMDSSSPEYAFHNVFPEKIFYIFT